MRITGAILEAGYHRHSIGYITHFKGFLYFIFSYFYICIFSGFPDSSVGKESACNAGDLASIPGLERSPGEEKGYPLQYSGLENSMGLQELDTTESLPHFLHYAFVVNFIYFCSYLYFHHFSLLFSLKKIFEINSYIIAFSLLF